jgi:oxygen-independent coproporphyrinogen-3 oxidase
VGEYLDALDLELAAVVKHQTPRQLETVYAGGGTPSRLGGDGVARMLQLVDSRASISSGAEVTIEANPDDITSGAVKAWLANGVNRLSIGAQTFDEAVLRSMHRTHDAPAIGRAVSIARDAGIANLSLDLILGVPASHNREWDADLAHAVALAPNHLSVYGLTVEPGTPLARWRDRGEMTEAPEETFEREFLHAHSFLVDAGFEHYEVSNYALPGERARHNSAYWTRVPFLGVGPSAHSFDGSGRWWNVSAYEAWRRRLMKGGSAVAAREQLTADSVDAEKIYLGLRTTSGVELNAAMRDTTLPWIDEGWAQVDSVGKLTLTALGWLRLDSLAASLTAVASRS